MGSTSRIGLALLSVSLCSSLLAGCVGGESESAPSAPADAALPSGSLAVGEYVLHIQPKLGRATLRSLKAAAPRPVTGIAKDVPALIPQVFSDINLQQDESPNTGPASSVELVTDQNSIFYNDVTNCGSAQSFCASVTLNSFWARHLSNVYVEVTSITDTSGNAIAGHNAVNSDSPPSTCTGSSGCPSTALGLWRYTQINAEPGVLNSNGSAVRQWRFANPDDADTYVKLRVVATLFYSSYTLSSSFRTVTNACSNGGTQVPVTQATKNASMPFSTTFYNFIGPQIKMNKHGYFSISTTAIDNSGANVLLPDATVQKPGVFAFWDNLDYGTSGTGMCYKVEGSAPSRKFIITWQDMTFNNATTASHMTFSTAVHEGSDEIDLYYHTMTGPNARSRGAQATVGAQDPTGTIAASGSTFQKASYTSGKSFTLIPIP